MYKNEVKIFLIITYVVLELLSMVFNPFFAETTIGNYYFKVNYSIFCFCASFFIVDIVNDFFSINDASRFLYYKVYSQIVFIILCKLLIYLYNLDDAMFAKMIDETPFMLLSSWISTYAGYRVMNNIMMKIKGGVYKGRSVFLRYINSTIPGELVFSIVFSVLIFSSGRKVNEVLHLISMSCIIKIILSIVFSFFITTAYKIRAYLLRNGIAMEKKSSIDAFDI